MRAHELFETTSRDIARMIRQHAKHEEESFHVLHHEQARHDAQRPLVVVVHPGDLVEHPYGWSDEDREKVLHFSEANQIGTARDVARWRAAGADVVILHRSSCEQFHSRSPGVQGELKIELETSWKQSSILFGDDLEAASQWIIENLHVSERPHVYLAGAYSDPENGCLTYVGKALERVIGSHRITVSDYSPSGSSPEPVWRGGNKVLDYEADKIAWPPRKALFVAYDPKQKKVLAKISFGRENYFPEELRSAGWDKAFKSRFLQYCRNFIVDGATWPSRFNPPSKYKSIPLGNNCFDRGADIPEDEYKGIYRQAKRDWVANNKAMKKMYDALNQKGVELRIKPA